MLTKWTRVVNIMARVFYISLMFSNARRVLSQCNAQLRLFYLLKKDGEFLTLLFTGLVFRNWR